MDAFIPLSSFTPRHPFRQNTSSSFPSLTPVRPNLSPYPVCLAKSKKSNSSKSKSPKPNSSKSKSSNPPSSSSFAGLAAGPGASKSSRPSLRRDAPRATRALGTTPRPAPAPPRSKTREEIIAEGVVDDVDEDMEFAGIVEGIDDVVDPFLVDEEKLKDVQRKEQESTEKGKIGLIEDVTGDGQVLKTLKTMGTGARVEKGMNVRVKYVGLLENGKEFDRSGDDGFEFESGAGKVIKGWEAGVATMRVGEIAELVIKPGYAYGKRGVPPVVKGGETLTFNIEVQEVSGGVKEGIRKVKEFNEGVARTPRDIKESFEQMKQTREEERKNKSFLDRFYIISPFASQTGERPPWWVNPNITSVLILLGTALGFYLVVKSGAIHIGYLDDPVDVNIFK